MSSTYQPGFIPDDDLAAAILAIRREFAAVKRGMEDAAPTLRLQTLHAAPSRVFSGLLVHADGTDWSPDGVNGEGLYLRNEANDGWDFIVAV